MVNEKDVQESICISLRRSIYFVALACLLFLCSTPAPGRVLDVRESDNLQKAIDGAKCGDTLKLEAGATFRGVFRLPSKSCDDSHWIIIRTSAPDNNLPAEGA